MSQTLFTCTPYRRVEQWPWTLCTDDEEKPTYGVEIDPLHPEHSGVDWYEHYVEPHFKHRRQIIEREHDGYQLFDDPLWRAFVTPFVHFRNGHPVEAELFNFYYSVDDSAHDYQEGEYESLRMLYTFLLKHRVNMMETLIRLDYAHVGCSLFPKLTWENGRSYHTTSLLGLALFEAQSAEGVEMLLKRGADPNGLHAKKGSSWLYEPDDYVGCGPNMIAWFDEHHAPADYDAVGMLTALFKYGGDLYGWQTLHFEKGLDPRHEAVLTREKRYRQMWHNALAAVCIIAHWRRVAAEPGSVAISKASKRFKAHSQM